MNRLQNQSASKNYNHSFSGQGSRWQGKPKRGALVGSALNADLSAMGFDNLLTNVEAQAQV